MFTKSGQPRSALSIFCNVAWGTSVGGLALIAEERRRRVAFAQKIIENGKVLQSFKSYQTPAALSEFDRGDSWNIPLPDSPPPPAAKQTESFPKQSLTNAEWRSRPRKHRLIPQTPLRDTEASAESRKSDHVATTTTSIYELPKSSIPSSDRTRHAAILQSLVARRVEACLSTNLEDTKRYGMAELSSYFQLEGRQGINEDMIRTVKLLRELDGAEGKLNVPSNLRQTLEKQVPFDEKSHYVTLQAGSADINHAGNHVRNVYLSEEDIQLQNTIADDISDFVNKNMINEAFYTFLDICERDIYRLTQKALSSIKLLVDSFKELGVYSVVKYIDQRLIAKFGDWYPIYADFPWLLQREIPRKFTALCVNSTKALQAVNQPDRAVELALAAGEHALQHKSVETLRRCINFFHSFLRELAENGYAVDPAIYLMARQLDDQAPMVGSTDKAKMLSNQVSAKSQIMASVDFYQSVVASLEKGDVSNAARIYLDRFQDHSSPQEMYSPLIHRRIFKACLRADLFSTCASFVNMLKTLRLPLEEDLVSTLFKHVKELLMFSPKQESQRNEQISSRQHETSPDDKNIHMMGLIRSFSTSLADNDFQHTQLTTLYSLFESGIFRLVADEPNQRDPSSSSAKEDRLLLHYKHGNLKLLPLNQMMSLFSLSASPTALLDFGDVLYALHEGKHYNLIIDLFETQEAYDHLNGENAVLVYDALVQQVAPVQLRSFLRQIAPFAKHQEVQVRDIHHTAMRCCYKWTRNVDMVRDIFQGIKAVGPSSFPSVGVYNVMIQACVDSSNLEEAQLLVNELTEVAKQRPTVYTFDQLLRSKALAKDWDGIEAILQNMCKLGMLKRRIALVGEHFFHKSFHEFCKRHDAEASMKYALRLYDVYGVPISSKISITLMHQIVSEERPDILTSWIRHLKERGLKPMIYKKSINLLLHRFRQARQFKFFASGLDMVSKSMSNEEATSKLIEVLQVFESQGARVEESGSLPKIRIPRGFKRVALDDEALRPYGEHPTEKRMLVALESKDPRGAVEIYRESLQHGLPWREVDLSLAVHASLTANGGSEEAEQLIKDAAEKGMNVSRAEIPMLVYSLRRRKVSTNEGIEIALSTYRFLSQNRVGLHHHVTMAILKNLQHQGNAQGALDVARAVIESEWIKEKPFDLICMTTLVQLHIEQVNKEGAIAVIDSVLNSGMRIDLEFTKKLETRLRDVRSGRARGSRAKSKDERRLLALELAEYVKKCREQRYKQMEGSRQFARSVIEQIRGGGKKEEMDDEGGRSLEKGEAAAAQ